ncbi:hypothetical protein [Edaphobacter dinghuensis]|uniref:Uncharacterized protein n=1 Tax=Edaphobacter dinghuensis TaxID=1560005 RepID=A0A917HQH5_9BACT|nr:hypothetical protein [Edaphobacter dinghuensis]GGG86491.1 hypothetical protein GCM10011585_33050 [Edaphobacter dinghuensis]
MFKKSARVLAIAAALSVFSFSSNPAFAQSSGSSSTTTTTTTPPSTPPTVVGGTDPEPQTDLMTVILTILQTL